MIFSRNQNLNIYLICRAVGLQPGDLGSSPSIKARSRELFPHSPHIYSRYNDCIRTMSRAWCATGSYKAGVVGSTPTLST